MRTLCGLLHSSIGRKITVATAGILLCGFLVTHLAGNLFLLVGENAFNHYAEVLEANPLLVPAEIGLLALFALHIVTSLWLKWENRRARPAAYAVSASKGGRTPGSGTMAATGTVILTFLIIHIKSFKYGDKPDGLYRLVMDSFAWGPYTVFYVVAMGALGLHLSHGVQSAFNTFGVNHPKYTPLIKKAGLGFAGLVAAGFAFLPIWACYLVRR